MNHPTFIKRWKKIEATARKYAIDICVYHRYIELKGVGLKTSFPSIDMMEIFLSGYKAGIESKHKEAKVVMLNERRDGWCNYGVGVCSYGGCVRLSSGVGPLGYDTLILKGGIPWIIFSTITGMRTDGRLKRSASQLIQKGVGPEDGRCALP